MTLCSKKGCIYCENYKYFFQQNIVQLNFKKKKCFNNSIVLTIFITPMVQ